MPSINQLTDAVAALDTDQRSRVADAIIATLSPDERADLANRIQLEVLAVTPRTKPLGQDAVATAGLVFLEVVGSVAAEAFNAQRALDALDASGEVNSHPQGREMFEALRDLSAGLNQTLLRLRDEIDALKTARLRGSN